MTGMIAYCRIDTPTKPSATLTANGRSASGRRRNATIAAASDSISNVNAGTSVMNVGASGPHSGPDRDRRGDEHRPPRGPDDLATDPDDAEQADEPDHRGEQLDRA